MTKLRLVLLATTALTAMQFASAPSHAQTAPQVMAQAQEPSKDGKQPPSKGAPSSHPGGGGPGPGAPAHQGAPPSTTTQTPHNVTPTTPTVTAPIKPTVTPNTS
jgi:hypothetical protein